MTRTLLLILALLLGPLAGATELDEVVPSASLVDSADRTHALGELCGKVVVLVAWSSRCPHSAGYAARLVALAQRYAPPVGQPPKVLLFGLASNDFETAATVEAARRAAKLPFPVLLDPKGGLGRPLKAFSTPTALVVDAQGVLRYRGAIDDDPREERGDARRHYLRDAVEAVLAGRKPDPNKTKVVGFRVKF